MQTLLLDNLFLRQLLLLTEISLEELVDLESNLGKGMQGLEEDRQAGTSDPYVPNYVVYLDVHVGVVFVAVVEYCEDEIENQMEAMIRHPQHYTRLNFHEPERDEEKHAHNDDHVYHDKRQNSVEERDADADCNT